MNNQTQEALKLAIATLQNARRKHFYCEDTYYSCPKHEDGCADDRQPYICNCGADELNAEIDISIHACKEALKPHPDCDEACMYQCEHERKHKALEQPAQEPVGYLQEESPNGKGFFATYLPMKDMKNKPLYTHPHQWQGLTDDEIRLFFARNMEHDSYGVMTNFAHAIEQALKEKNHGL